MLNDQNKVRLTQLALSKIFALSFNFIQKIKGHAKTGRHFAKDLILMAVRWIKYLKNMIEPDRRSIKNSTKYTLGFKSFEAPDATMAGIELHRMIKKN